MAIFLGSFPIYITRTISHSLYCKHDQSTIFLRYCVSRISSKHSVTFNGEEIMQKDWRTDNWAGHKPVSYRYNDRNLYFPRTTKEIGWGDYEPQFTGFKKPSQKINWWMVGFFVLLFLLLHNLGIV